MHTVTVRTKKPYDVLIERGLTDKLPALLAPYRERSITIVSDSHVAPLHLSRVESILGNAGFKTAHFVFEAGEAHKTIKTLDALLTFLYENEMTRSDLLLALGGGLTGDLTGLAAALYCRGTEFIQLPTSLLAAVDASVGGKTAVNLHGAKNQVGVFHQPSAVLCDTAFLDTLPPARFAEGMAEVIKYGFIGDASLLDRLTPILDIDAVIADCVRAKARIVTEDEFEHGVRKLLNFGHTFGHAVEAVSHHEISHGDAVSIGMCRAYRAALRAGICLENLDDRLYPLLDYYGLPTDTSLDYKALCASMRHDKKRASGDITLVLPKRLGECVCHTLQIDQIEEFFAPSTESEK